jgi:hypothetical protein
MKAFHFLTSVIMAVVTAMLQPIARLHERLFVMALNPGDVHIDTPLSNIAIEAFQQGDYVGQLLFPVVPVDKQSNKYYKVDKGSWLKLPRNDLRAPKTAPKRVEWTVSSDSYFADNHVLAGELPREVTANQDAALSLWDRETRFVTDMLLRVLENRIASKVTSISNMGSGIALTAGAKWSAYASSDPISDVTTGRAFMRQSTGLYPNTAVIDADTINILQRHPVLVDYFKYTAGGVLTLAQIAAAFQVPNILVAKGIKDNGQEGVTTSSMVNIWGNCCVLAYVEQGQTIQTRTLGLGFRWINEEQLGMPMVARRYPDPDPGKKLDIVEVGYYQDEKIVAPELGYVINSTL